MPSAIARIAALRYRANEHRKIAATSRFPGDWLFQALKFDSRADVIWEAVKAGKPVPKVDFGNEPFRG